MRLQLLFLLPCRRLLLLTRPAAPVAAQHFSKTVTDLIVVIVALPSAACSSASCLAVLLGWCIASLKRPAQMSVSISQDSKCAREVQSPG